MSNVEYGTMTLLVGLLLAIVGYWFGFSRSFKEHKLKVYGDMLPIMVRFLFSGRDAKEFNKELVRMWVYADKAVAYQMEKAIRAARVLHGSSVKDRDARKSEFLREVQTLIVAMRYDVQPWWRCGERTLSPERVTHFQFEEET